MAKGSRTRPVSKPAAPAKSPGTRGVKGESAGREVLARREPGRAPASPITVGEFQGLIRTKYHATDSARGVPGTFMWFMEEVGELATALQNNAMGKAPTAEQRANLEEEFADVLAWLMTLANIAGAEGGGVDMERAIEKFTKPGRVEGVKE